MPGLDQQHHHWGGGETVRPGLSPSLPARPRPLPGGERWPGGPAPPGGDRAETQSPPPQGKGAGKALLPQKGRLCPLVGPPWPVYRARGDRVDPCRVGGSLCGLSPFLEEGPSLRDLGRRPGPPPHGRLPMGLSPLSPGPPKVRSGRCPQRGDPAGPPPEGPERVEGLGCAVQLHGYPRLPPPPPRRGIGWSLPDGLSRRRTRCSF